MEARSEMNDDVRRAVAFAAAARINRKSAHSVYDHALKRHVSMSENYDYGCNAHLSGVTTGNLYHYGSKAHVSLDVDGSAFRGFDYDSRSHFSGTVSESNVQIYDYDKSRYFNYQV
jgi:hypothetical protein